METERARDTIAVPPPPPRLRFEELLRGLAGREVTLGALVDEVGAAGFGLLTGLLALVAIPFVGVSTPFGIAIALIGAQLALGRGRPWLPARLRARKLTSAMLERVTRLFERRARRLARLARPRWEAAVLPRLVGVGIVLLALGLALPLPFPGSNLVFLVPLFVYAIGLLERDGVWIALGHLGTLVDLALLVVFGGAIVQLLERVWSCA